MGSVVDVNATTFEEDVLEQSFQTPVVIDFYAQWCGPCQMLKPVLENLAQEYNFVLAKVDIDQNPEIARIYKVEGVPDVKVAVQGQVYNGFVGMLPEPQLRDFLAQLDLKSSFDDAIAVIAAAKAAGDWEQVEAGYAALLKQYPTRSPLLLQAAQFYLDQGNLDRARSLLDHIDPLQASFGKQAEALRSLMDFHQVVTEITPDTPAARLYLSGAKAAISQNYEAAMEHFLELVKQDRQYRKDAGRKAMLTLFGVLGDDHPLTQTYRKRLMQTLY